MNQKAFPYDYSSEDVETSYRLLADRQLLMLVADGNEFAFKELYERYSIGLYNFISRLVFDEAVAEDILQDVFFAIWRGASQFRGQSKVKTWMYNIAHNQTVSWLRRKNVVVKYKELLDGVSLNDPEIEYVESWKRDQILMALDKLSTDHRAVIELAFFHGLSYAEISGVIGCPIGTVKSRMSYARRYLNFALSEIGIRSDE